MGLDDNKKKEGVKRAVDAQAGQTKKDYHAHLMATQIEVAKATERAIAIGQDITLMLDNEKPITAVLVAYCLAKNYMTAFPKLWAYVKKLPI